MHLKLRLLVPVFFVLTVLAGSIDAFEALNEIQAVPTKSASGSKPATSSSPKAQPSPTQKRNTTGNVATGDGKGDGPEVRTESAAADDGDQQAENTAPKKVAGGSPASQQKPKVEDPPPSLLDSWWSILLYGLPILLLLGLIGGGIFLFFKKIQNSENKLLTELGGFRRKQADLTKNLEAYMKVSADLSQQLANHKSEIAKLKQMVGNQSTSTAFAPPPPPGNVYEPPPPRFPMSVEDYLSKHGAGSVAVKYDYKEAMLVQDAANEGGLLVVQDEGRSLLVPSFGFFQTKSDFTNYFEKYYVCDRPMGGNVWIKQPASVIRADGGWRLESQGELEVR